VSLIRSVRISLGAVSLKWVAQSLWRDEVKEHSPMFMLPQYDPTAIAMLGFGILAVLSLLSILAT
jgi:hypothetical protein